jgi:DNA-binding transcriptional ArsR family regulator
MPDATRADPGLIFDALADATRRDVLRAVAEDGPLTATQLAARLPVTRQAVSKHLGTLEAAGLVASERVGRDVRFSLDPAPLDGAVAWITAVGARWDRRLGALERRVSGRSRGQR